MTTTDERWMAVDNVREFLYELQRTGNKVPKDIKAEALRLLKHYPSPYYTEQAKASELSNG